MRSETGMKKRRGTEAETWRKEWEGNKMRAVQMREKFPLL